MDLPFSVIGCVHILEGAAGLADRAVTSRHRETMLSNDCSMNLTAWPNYNPSSWIGIALLSLFLVNSSLAAYTVGP